MTNIIADETRFGMGCEFKQRRQHEVMDENCSQLDVQILRIEIVHLHYATPLRWESLARFEKKLGEKKLKKSSGGVA